MKLRQAEVSLKTESKLQIINITRNILQVVENSGLKNGFAVIHIPHTTAGLAVNEADPDLWEDIIEALTRIVPVKGRYRHNLKYSGVPSEQNAHAHILNCLLRSTVALPFYNGQLALGTWQSILFVELDGPRSRRVNVTLYGE